MVGVMIRLGTAVSCLCSNKESTTTIVAGRNILKVFHVSDTEFEEVDSLRSRGHQSLNYSTNDIDWSSANDGWFATAATNGAIVLWDINKLFKIRTVSILNHHTRTVNRIMFHPTEQLLLTGAQDGRTKFYDLRMQKVSAELPGSCSVRDMRFNPNPVYFSTAFDNGTVVMWDIRNLQRSERTITCHNGAVLSIDWHPDPGDGQQWLVTGGLRDSLVKVWQLSSAGLACTSQARMADSVRKVRWRPDSSKQQVLTAHMMYPDLYAWDMKRPFVPRLSFEGHTEPVTGLLWRDQRRFPRQFLSVGKDGMVFLRKVEESRQPAREANPMGLSISCRGSVMVALARGQLDPLRREKADKEGWELCSSTGTLNGDTDTSSPIFPHTDTRGHYFMQSVPVDVVPKLKPSTSMANSLSTKRGHLDNHLPFSSTKSLMMEFNFSTDLSQQYLSADVFVTLACGYRLRGASTDDLCDHNARVAGQLGLAYVQAVWTMLRTMCSSGAAPKPAGSGAGATPSTSGAAPGTGGLGQGPGIASQGHTPSVEALASALNGPALPADAGGTTADGGGGEAAPCGAGIVSDGGEAEEREVEREDRGVYSRSGQETTTANSEDDGDLIGDGQLEKLVTTFANVEPIDFLFSDGREEVDLLDVFSTAQNDGWSEEVGHLPREVIQPYHEIDHLPVSEIGDAWDPNDLSFGLDGDADREGLGGDSSSRPYSAGTNNSQSTTQRRLRSSGGFKHNSGREHSRRTISESTTNDADGHSSWVAQALVDYNSRALASQTAVSSVPRLDYGPLIAEMLCELVERLGDVQTACCALIVIGEPLRVCVDFERYGVWLLEYLDSLARYQLWCESTMVINLCGHPQVGLRNQEGTFINTKCSRCGKAVAAGGVCQKHSEKPPIVCVVCHQAVRGLYMWCQGCGHGGHMQHLQEWLANNTDCPAGCGHKCEYC